MKRGLCDSRVCVSDIMLPCEGDRLRLLIQKRHDGGGTMGNARVRRSFDSGDHHARSLQ